MSDSSQGLQSLSAQERNKLIQALQVCTAMQDPAMRDAIVAELRSDIRNRIKRHSSIQLDVRNTVITSMNFAGGLEELIEAVRIFEGDTLQMQAVDKLMHSWVAPSAPTAVEPEHIPAPQTFGMLRLDAGLPAMVTRSEPFEVAVALRQPTSPPLTAASLSQLPFADDISQDVEQVTFQATYRASGCRADGPTELTIPVTRGRDSDVFFFRLAVTSAVERLRVTVFIQLEGKELGNLDLYTDVYSQPVGKTAVTPKSIDLPSEHARRLFLRKALSDFDIQGICDLAVMLGFHCDDLSGSTRSSKAGALVEKCRQMGRIDRLYEEAQRKWPDTNWTLLPDLSA
jgi:hypothetical protein